MVVVVVVLKIKKTWLKTATEFSALLRAEPQLSQIKNFFYNSEEGKTSWIMALWNSTRTSGITALSKRSRRLCCCLSMCQKGTCSLRNFTLAYLKVHIVLNRFIYFAVYYKQMFLSSTYSGCQQQSHFVSLGSDLIIFFTFCACSTIFNLHFIHIATFNADGTQCLGYISCVWATSHWKQDLFSREVQIEFNVDI